MNKKRVAIIGSGPAGMFCAYQLAKAGVTVTHFEKESGVGKKFLVAGHGGLNLTHSEPIDNFILKYSPNESRMGKYIFEFGPDDLRSFCKQLGTDTFVGSSGRVFPTKMNAAEILINWKNKLKEFSSYELKTNHILTNWNGLELTFKFKETNLVESFDYIVFALGGSSWKKTGSDGEWAALFFKNNIIIEDFKPMNCGFEVEWSDFLKDKLEKRPYLKNIGVKFKENKQIGEMMLTPYGVEGSSIYALSLLLRQEIKKTKYAILSIDFKPSMNIENIISRLESCSSKNSFSNKMRKSLNLSQGTITLLREEGGHELNSNNLAVLIKEFPLKLVASRGLDESISTSGGVSWNELDSHLMIKKCPKVFVTGEMIDWEAPTGGYLLQGCFSTANHVANQIISWPSD